MDGCETLEMTWPKLVKAIAETVAETKTFCNSPLATRALLYSDTLGGKQISRDDMWAVTTAELNEQAISALSPSGIERANSLHAALWEFHEAFNNRGETTSLKEWNDRMRVADEKAIKELGPQVGA